ncbi:MAG TPA: CCA tRNA nucleotidyltransferase [Candidatus Nitrosocosmicus sp.]|nr:CCA tRNA nucleotidyltransferase [Candidatus Nitrosocosmicus sp.]
MQITKMNDDLVKLIDNVIDNCTPSKSEQLRLENIAISVKDQIENFISNNKYSFVTDVVFGGSFAKGTWLKNETDIDIFVKFDSQIDFVDFENYGKEIGLKSLRTFSPYLRYADHPYVEAFVETVKINVVPCFDVPYGRWKSAADRSPFHTDYVINNLDNDKKNQVRILKKFLKSLNIYGAEISTKGFSGYVSEVLVIKFGSFLSVLDYFSDYSFEKRIITVDSVFVDAKKEKKFNSPLIVLDPVDYNRNLGTAISSLSVATFILSSRAFLMNPKSRFFTDIQKTEPIDPSIIGLYSSNILIIEFKFSFRAPDVIWGQLQKTAGSISKSIESYGFNILKNISFTDEKEHCVLAFLLDSVIIPKFYKRAGPDILRKSDSEKFIESNSRSNLKWLSDDNRINCILSRDYTDIRDYLKFLINSKHELLGVPKGLKLDFMSSAQIYTLDQQKNISKHLRDSVFELLYTDDRIF